MMKNKAVELMKRFKTLQKRYILTNMEIKALTFKVKNLVEILARNDTVPLPKIVEWASTLA